MKTILIFIFFISFKLFSQKEFDTEIESNSRPGILYYFTWKPSNKPKVRKYDRFIFDVYYTDASDPKNIIKKLTPNIGLTVNFMNEFALTKKNTVSIGTGIGLSTTKVNLSSNLLLGHDNSIVCFPSSTSDYKRNSLNGFNINVPIELRFKTKGWSHYKIHVGGRLGYQVKLSEKYFFEDSNRNYKKSLKSAVENFTYSVHTR
ncbi:MAG: hypothetical protein ACKO6A_03655, partial [Bacteroidota bacterium]